MPGMVVDNAIVSRNYFDFYLSAHYGALGEFPFADWKFVSSNLTNRL